VRHLSSPPSLTLIVFTSSLPVDAFSQSRVVSITSPPSFVLHAYRRTGARTPARPVPPPSGARRRGRQDRHSVDVVAFACVSASCRAHLCTKWCSMK
jgi:hypothetical protein